MRSPRWNVLLLLIVVIAAALAGPEARAQEFRGAIAGVVTDATQSALPGVTVTVANVATKVSTEVVTDDQGRYQVRYLNPGTYTVTARLEGFKTSVSTVEVCSCTPKRRSLVMASSPATVCSKLPGVRVSPSWSLASCPWIET